MQVETSRFGTIEVPDDDIVVFPDGLPGFRGRHEMIMLGAGQLPGSIEFGDQHSLFWIQDVVDPDLAFLTIVPWTAYPDYDFDIEPDDIAGTAADDLCILNIVTVRREHGGVRLTTNLLAPVVIDTRARAGKQVILTDRSWPVHAPLAEADSPTTPLDEPVPEDQSCSS